MKHSFQKILYVSMVFLVSILSFAIPAQSQSFHTGNNYPIILKLDHQSNLPLISKNFESYLDNGNWQEYQLFYIDSIFNMINNGLTRVFADLNGKKFILTTYPEEVKLGDNTFLIPEKDTIVINIKNFLILDDFSNPKNLIRLYPQGPGGADAIIIIGDQVLGDKIDFVLRLVELPRDLILNQNFPNPFNGVTTIKFSVSEALLFGARIRIDIFNLSGQKVRTLIEGKRFPGTFEATWNGKNDFGKKVASGMYFYQLKLNNRVKVNRMILVR